MAPSSVIYFPNQPQNPQDLLELRILDAELCRTFSAYNLKVRELLQLDGQSPPNQPQNPQSAKTIIRRLRAHRAETVRS
jgi:hypothetical protein